MSPRLTEDIACGAIMFERFRRALCLPRYTPRQWWECDVFELTERGYFREYEVKLTLRDFHADAEKSQDIRSTGRWVQNPARPGCSNYVCDQEKKHALLAMGDPRGPVEFWFVTPVGLVTPDALPPFAGLIELHDRGEGHRPTWRWSPHIVVQAPRLHEQKADAKIRQDLFGSCYYRLHEAMRTIRDRSEPALIWTDEAPPATEVTAA